jgi:predicted Zn finger-like uncharacterized protein
MAIEFNCPNCNAIIRVPDNAGGGKGRCPRCNTRIKVPKTSMPRVEKKDADDLDLFAPPGFEDAPGDAPIVEAADVGQVPESLEEEVFVPRARGLGELPAEQPRKALRPGSISAKLKKKKSGGGGLVAVIFGIIVCGAFGGYYWYLQQADRLSGQLTAEAYPDLELKPAELSVSMFGRSVEDMKTILEELQKSPVRMPSTLMQIQIGATKRAVTVQVSTGTQTQLYRVDVQHDPALMKFRSAHGVEYEELRVADIQQAGPDFVLQYQRVLDKSAKRDVLTDFRNSLAIPALVRGLGHQMIAVNGSTTYRCIYEDNEGALYFLMPGGVKTFEIMGIKHPDGKTLFPGKYQVKVVAGSKPTGKEKTDKNAPAGDKDTEKPEMSEPKEDGEMKDMKKDMEDGEMKMEDKPKKKMEKRN